MSRIGKLFEDKKKDVLNVYFTAGYPFLDSTVPVMKSLQDAGADMIELGMSYSDPLADGPVIQASATTALANGMTLKKLFEQLKQFRTHIHVPVLLMGYMNPVLQFGFEEFCREASVAGIDGLILPDLPMYEYEKEFGAIIKRHGLDFVFLVTPETDEERVKKLDGISSGFLYAVSSSSTTGKNASIDTQESYFKRLRSMKLKNPVLIGFGIKDKESFSIACSHANGAIIGTAFIRLLGDTSRTELPAAVNQFVKSIR